MLRWNAKCGLSDSGFEKLLKMMKNMLPKDNVLPASTYEAKKVVCPLGLEVQKIHACPNDCILYRGQEYENLNACPVCTALRYKIRRDDPGDVEGDVTAPVWYPKIWAKFCAGTLAGTIFLGGSPSISPGSSFLILYRNAVHTGHLSIFSYFSPR